MELKIEQVLQQGVDAQKKGKLQDAERLYREILQSHPVKLIRRCRYSKLP